MDGFNGTLNTDRTVIQMFIYNIGYVTYVCSFEHFFDCSLSISHCFLSYSAILPVIKHDV